MQLGGIGALFLLVNANPVDEELCWELGLRGDLSDESSSDGQVQD
jgi:hypothetical protein